MTYRGGTNHDWQRIHPLRRDRRRHHPPRSPRSAGSTSNRTEIETTTHGPRERRTHRVGLKRDAPVTVRLNYRENDEPVVRLLRPLRIGRVRGICSDLPGPLGVRVRGVRLRSRAGDAPGRTDPSVVPVLTDRSDLNARLSAIGLLRHLLRLLAVVRPGDDYPAAPAGGMPGAV